MTSPDAGGEDFLYETRRLERYSLEQPQNAFAKALSDITGHAYEVEIRTLDRHRRTS